MWKAKHYTTKTEKTLEGSAVLEGLWTWQVKVEWYRNNDLWHQLISNIIFWQEFLFLLLLMLSLYKYMPSTITSSLFEDKCSLNSHDSEIILGSIIKLCFNNNEHAYMLSFNLMWLFYHRQGIRQGMTRPVFTSCLRRNLPSLTSLPQLSCTNNTFSLSNNLLSSEI